MDIVEVLNDAGYKTITGKEALEIAIQEVADLSTTPLCSGYGVFPGGEKCPGCNDCKSR